MWLCKLNVRCVCGFFFFQAEDGIRDLVRSRGLGDVYKRQVLVVNDGSTDGTQEILAKFPDINIVNLPTNKGKGLSLIHI